MRPIVTDEAALSVGLSVYLSVYVTIVSPTKTAEPIHMLFSERERTFTFAITISLCYRPSVCLSSVCLSVTFVRPTQAVQIFGNISTALGTLAIH